MFFKYFLPKTDSTKQYISSKCRGCAFESGNEMGSLFQVKMLNCYLMTMPILDMRRSRKLIWFVGFPTVFIRQHLTTKECIYPGRQTINENCIDPIITVLEIWCIETASSLNPLWKPKYSTFLSIRYSTNKHCGSVNYHPARSSALR